MAEAEALTQAAATARTPEEKSSKRQYLTLLCSNYVCLAAGSVGSSLLAKFYFNHGGSSRWVSTWVQSAGFPLLFIPIYLPYLSGYTNRKPFSQWTLQLTTASAAVGLLLGVNNLLFSWGTSYLPVSTSSLLLSTQLAFTLLLSALIVRQRVTFANLNCVVLLTLSSLLLALTSAHDRPHGLTRRHYFVGFFSTIAAGLLFALYLPVMEKIYRKVQSYGMVMEMQLIMEGAATLLATVGMAATGGFREMRREGEVDFDLGGPTGYALTVAANVVAWQFCFMGTAGMVFLTSSLTGGICMTALLTLNVLAGVVVYGDNFGGPKAVSTFLAAWAFSSYVYGMYVKTKKCKEEEKPTPPQADDHDVEMTSTQTPVV
ncbi:hypothetical protein V2J09_009520 [Rumex salicifolius]